MDSTANLLLPYIMPSQAQKHVTHNEAVAMLDALVQLAVVDRDLASPPVVLAEGDRYIVASAATGAWSGEEDSVAFFQDGGWVFLPPRTGWIAWVVDETLLVYWTGSDWSPIWNGVALQELERLGIGAIADAANPLTAKLNNVLFTAIPMAEGGDGDLRFKLNKEAAPIRSHSFTRPAGPAAPRLGLPGTTTTRSRSAQMAPTGLMPWSWITSPERLASRRQTSSRAMLSIFSRTADVLPATPRTASPSAPLRSPPIYRFTMARQPPAPENSSTTTMTMAGRPVCWTLM